MFSNFSRPSLCLREAAFAPALLRSRSDGDDNGHKAAYDHFVHVLRHHLKLHRALAAWLIGTALLMKLLVPAGFMPVFSARSVTIQLCTGAGPQRMAMPMATMPHMDHHAPAKSEHGGKEMPCGFGGLTLPSLSAADPIQLAMLLRHIIAAGVTREAESVAASTAHLRPPSRGPPEIA